MKVVRTIAAVSLAILVLVSSTSFMVGIHFCMGRVQNVALFEKADSCEKEKSIPPCHRQEEAPCCADETIVHKADDFKASLAHFHFVAPVLMDIEQPFIVISETIPTASIARIKYYDYDPPLRSCDLTVEHRVFLI